MCNKIAFKSKCSIFNIFALLALLLTGCTSVSNSSNFDSSKDLLYQILKGEELPSQTIKLFNKPSKIVLDYSKYGEFKNAGTKDFVFTINKMDKLRNDSIPGIYPNQAAIKKDKDFMSWQEQGLLNANEWDAINFENYKLAFYIWSQSYQPRGVKLLFIGSILEKAGQILPAINAYYASIVFDPKAYLFNKDQTYLWYSAQSAMDNIKKLIQMYPSLNLDYVNYKFGVENGYDTNINDDIVKVSPGRIIRKTLKQKRAALPDISKMKVVNKRGSGRVTIENYENGHWRLMVDGRPFFIRGISYSPTKVGIGANSDLNYAERWMFSDINNNGFNDAAYDAWVDKNLNDIKDDDESAIGDFKLLQNIGINTIRYYAPNYPKNRYEPTLINKELLREMHFKFGISVAIGDFLGAYTIGNSADYQKGTDYMDEDQLREMKKVVYDKVMDLKDEPFVLMWILGNENSMGLDYEGVNATRTNASIYPEAYAKFLNDVAKMIHEIDRDHPVAVGNIELQLFDYYKKYAPEIDILGVNSYRGSKGFGSLWADAKDIFDRPIAITEYGCDAYWNEKGVDETAQKNYFKGKFSDIVLNRAGGLSVGNSIGGFIYEYLDEWWKDTMGAGEDLHDIKATFAFDFPDGYSQEEWLGIAGQGDGKNSPFKRQLRQAYYYFEGLREFK